MKVVSINQPAYLPWLGYFHRIAISDLHIVLDHVQFEKNSFTNRNKIRMKEGWTWLTVPVKTKGRFPDLSISQLEIADDPHWAKKHLSTLQMSYSRALFFRKHATEFETVYSQHWSRFIDLLRETTGYLLEAFGIKTRIIYSSEMDVKGQKAELIFNLCKAVGATVYVSGPLGKGYLHEQPFRQAGMRVAYHNYIHPIYPQAFPNFEPYMSAVDLLFNCGPKSLDIIMKDQEKISE